MPHPKMKQKVDRCVIHVNITNVTLFAQNKVTEIYQNSQSVVVIVSQDSTLICCSPAPHANNKERSVVNSLYRITTKEIQSIHRSRKFT